MSAPQEKLQVSKLCTVLEPYTLPPGTGVACGRCNGSRLAEHQGQVAFADDQDPLQQLAAEGRHSVLGH
jgi:hypothetical protein